MKIRDMFIVVAALCCASTPIFARIMEHLEYDELWEKSDFVVIAEPVSKTADTPEITHFPNIIRRHPDGTKSDLPAIGVETVFEVRLVLKGDNATNRFVLHHYREAEEPPPNAISLGSPLIVSFDPEDRRKHRNVLLFLMKEEDGRFAPYGGQTDPSGRAIFALEAPNRY